LTENLEADFGDLSQFDPKLLNKKDEADFEANKILKITAAKNADFCKPETLAKTKTLICKTQNANLKRNLFLKNQPKGLTQVLANGLRYLRWGGDGEAVQPEKG
jgi:hypothetical protein